jgi:hypothetical protein
MGVIPALCAMKVFVHVRELLLAVCTGSKGRFLIRLCRRSFGIRPFILGAFDRGSYSLGDSIYIRLYIKTKVQFGQYNFMVLLIAVYASVKKLFLWLPLVND